ncbi:LacI family transcriptional regulator [Salana multivorans]|uniref:LacI family transcriptional regulator n=1 Tax=Salana multivorans TaxID=120377 RepID=A0A3N2D8J9_9MICO|nr:LacI family DNA-binding transcriptional regulator [Salana multivorans]ROR96032.1 LacI family transcriptional regulator [Salana multivorans]
MAQVARLAEVSIATVSFVVNDDPKAKTLTQATRDRVLEAVRMLDYRPNLQARGLRTQRSHSIAVLTDHLTAVPFANSTIRGVQERAWAGGYLVTTMTTDDNAELAAHAVEMVLARQFDAVIVTTAYTHEVTVPSEFAAMPLVLLNCFSGDGYRTVLPGERAGARSAAKVLIDAGHTRIGFINGLRTTWAAGERRLGYRDALREAGLEYDRTLVRSGTYETDSGYRHAMALLDRADPPTAIMCASDRMAVGAYYAAYQRGLRIPEDLSVVGYDNHTEFSEHAVPAMTTVSLPYYEMGLAAVDLLLAPERAGKGGAAAGAGGTAGAATGAAGGTRVVASTTSGATGSHVTEIACEPVIRQSVAAPSSRPRARVQHPVGSPIDAPAPRERVPLEVTS